MQLVNTVSKLEAILMQLKNNNAELIQLVKDQCNTNDVIRSENTALIQQVAPLRVEANSNDDIRTVHDKLGKLSSDVANLMQPTCEKKSSAAVARCKQRSVLVFDDEQLLRNMKTVTTADNEEVKLHKTSKATPKDLLVAVKWSDVCKNANELTIVCGDGITEDANMEEVKQDFSGLVITATEDIHRVTISSVLPSTAGTQDDKIKEINNFIRYKCRDTGARFIDYDQNVLFRDGSCYKNDGICLSDSGINKCHLGTLAIGTSERGATRRYRLATGFRNNDGRCHLVNSYLKRAAIRRMQQNSPDIRPPGAGHRAAAGHVRIAGQRNNCGETNHVTQTCRHVNAVSCFVCGQKGHNSKHHVNMN